MAVLITKQDGAREEFDTEKLRRSLKRVGCSEGTCDEVINEVVKELHDGDSTSKIYREAFKLLRTKEKPLAARYSMKRAVLELGPSGYPFEDFVGAMFQLEGFDVEVGKYIKGICAPHEVDVYALRNDTCIGAELKFHNSLGAKTDLKVALYVYARFEDIKKAHPRGRVEGGVDEGWLITNTAFTQNAKRYGACVGLTMVSWEYPEHGNLMERIEQTGVQPVTALTTLSKHDKNLLIKEGVVLCRWLRNEQSKLRSLGLSKQKIEASVAESDALCGAV